MDLFSLTGIHQTLFHFAMLALYPFSLLNEATHSSPCHRDPHHFPRVLAFLRGALVMGEVPLEEQPSLLREATFFSLDAMVHQLEV